MIFFLGAVSNNLIFLNWKLIFFFLKIILTNPKIKKKKKNYNFEFQKF